MWRSREVENENETELKTFYDSNKTVDIKREKSEQKKELVRFKYDKDVLKDRLKHLEDQNKI